ncbi:hypothetical protein [Candidatus Methylacidithermus pantelleriae]|uniref:Uncharacterized protein n=1 Tax=Candidatus Methylacidithermus pantelleriae TaxID=2744239 RepID=A0A8J2BPN8_9BACT|nr:hypothetical protein [Candidatus Methylacidithermus pantelleriae]CAF0699858.1 hypothetical protein MPNT_300020 [Candidatus Methylacidithermus pantelleriae]
MNGSPLVTSLLLAFLIQVPGCFSQKETKSSGQETSQASGGLSISIVPLLKRHKDCEFTEEDRFTWTYYTVLSPGGTWDLDAAKDAKWKMDMDHRETARLLMLKHVECSEIPRMVGNYLSTEVLRLLNSPDVCCAEVSNEYTRLLDNYRRVAHFLAAKNPLGHWYIVYDLRR